MSATQNLVQSKKIPLLRKTTLVLSKSRSHSDEVLSIYFSPDGKTIHPQPVATDPHSHGVTRAQVDSLYDIVRQAVERQQVAGGSFLGAHKGEIVSLGGAFVALF